MEKKVIGEKKFLRYKKSLASSLDIGKKINFGEVIKNNELNEGKKDLKSNNSDENHRNNINEKMDNLNGNVKTNSGNKLKKLNSQRIINKYIARLKNFCSKLIIIKKGLNIKSGVAVPNKKKQNESFSPSTVKKRRKNEGSKNHKSGKDKFLFDDSHPLLYTNELNNTNRQIYSIVNLKMGSENKNYPIRAKLKSQTKIQYNLFKLQGKKQCFKKHNTIGKCEEDSITRKKSSPKKLLSPKKMLSPKKTLASDYGQSKNFRISLKVSKREKEKENKEKEKEKEKDKVNEVNNKKFISNNISLVKKNNIHKLLSKRINENNEKNEKINSNLFKVSNNTKNNKKKYKKSLTINKLYKFRAGELLEKKINNIKLNDNNKY